MMAKKLKMHFNTGNSHDYDYRRAACGFLQRKEITTTAKRRVTCSTCLKWLRRHRA